MMAVSYNRDSSQYSSNISGCLLVYDVSFARLHLRLIAVNFGGLHISDDYRIKLIDYDYD